MQKPRQLPTRLLASGLSALALVLGLCAQPAAAAVTIAIAPVHCSKKVKTSAKILKGVGGNEPVLMSKTNKIIVRYRVEDLTAKLITSLVQASKFSVVERSKLDRLISEQSLAKEGLVDPATAAKFGKLLGAKYFVIPEISVYECNVRHQYFSVISRYKRIVDINITIDFRVVDTSTGKIIFADAVSDTSNVTSSLTGKPKTGPLRAAVHDKMQRSLAAKFVEKLVNALFPIKVIRFRSGVAYLNRGSKGGVSKAQLYAVYEQGEALVDEDTGLKLGAEEELVALIEVTDTHPKFSKAKVKRWLRKQHSIADGSLCRLSDGKIQAPKPKPKDTTPPKVQIISPKDGLVLNRDHFTVRISCPDKDTAELLVNGQPAKSAQNGEYSFAYFGREGLNKIVVSARDRVGNRSQASVSITVDTQAPSFQILEPKAGGVLGGDRVKVLIACKDQDLKSLTANGAEAEATIQKHQWVAYLSADSLNKSRGLITVLAKDQAGNLSRQQVSLSLDSKPPSISIVSPKGYVLKNPVTVVIRCDDDDLAQIKVRDLVLTRLVRKAKGRTRTYYTGKLELKQDGPFKLPIRAWDKSGNVTKATTEFVLDTQKPLLHLVSPENGAAITKDFVTIHVACLDKDLAKLTINGQKAKRLEKQGHFGLATKVQAGRNTIKVVATDRAGHSSTLTSHFVADNRPPQISLSYPPQGGVFSERRVLVQVDCQDSDLDRILIAGRPARPLGKGRYGRDVGGDEGPYKVLIEAFDKAGNKSTLTSQFQLDRTKPKLVMLAPKKGASINSNPVNVWVQVKDPDVTSVTINGQPASAKGKGRYSLQIKAGQGMNKIRAEAKDKAGNIGFVESWFRFDSQAPSVSAAVKVVVRGKVDDPQSTVTINGKPAKVKADGSYKLEVELGKDRKVVIVATDPFGNSKKVVKQY